IRLAFSVNWRPMSTTTGSASTSTIASSFARRLRSPRRRNCRFIVPRPKARELVNRAQGLSVYSAAGNVTKRERGGVGRRRFASAASLCGGSQIMGGSAAPAGLAQDAQELGVALKRRELAIGCSLAGVGRVQLERPAYAA